MIFLRLKRILSFIEAYSMQKHLTRMQDNLSPRGAKEACIKRSFYRIYNPTAISGLLGSFHSAVKGCAVTGDWEEMNVCAKSTLKSSPSLQGCCFVCLHLFFFFFYFMSTLDCEIFALSSACAVMPVAHLCDRTVERKGKKPTIEKRGRCMAREEGSAGRCWGLPRG